MLSKAMPHGLAVIIFLIINSIYFSPQLEGKKVRQGDIISFEGASKELKDHKEETGKSSLWTNSMFGGMPAYQINAPQDGNKIRLVEQISNLFIKRPIGYFIGAMICFYIMLVFFGANPWISILGALAFGLTTNNLVLFEAGHATKIRSLIFFAPIVLGVILTYKRKFLFGGIVFALGMALNLNANHFQMTYYLALCLLIYIVMQLVHDYKKKELGSFFKASAILVLGLLLAVGSSASKLWTTYEYSKDTMRGKPILAADANSASTGSSAVNGLDWEYAMMWSNGTMDVLSSFIPGIVGGGSAEPVGKDSKFYKDLSKRGARLGDNPKAPLYWGALPFTSGPTYFGAIMVFLFILGTMMVKGRYKWWIVSAIGLTVLMSFGKNLWLNRILFDYLPMLNKFRSPNSVLTVTSFFVPILGTIVLSNIVKGKYEKEDLLKKLKMATLISGGFALFFAVLGPAMFDFSSAGDARYAQAGLVDSLVSDRVSLMRSDALRSLMFVLLAAGLIWALIQKKMKESLFVLVLGLSIVVDLWGVGRRYLNEESFVSKRQYSANFKERKADYEILKDKDPNYRVFDLSVNTFNSASSSYYHKTIGGYHAAKLQRYQDVIDFYISKGHSSVLNMLNTKYIITKDQQVQRNPVAFGNAWFVNNLSVVQNPNEEIAAIGKMDLRSTAVILAKEFNDYANGFQGDGNGSISLTSYAPDEIQYAFSSSSEQFAVFSEIWYGPNKGWRAIIDGEEVDHVRVNYLLRGMKIPAGNHTIIFKFEPANYYTGETISLIFSMLIIMALIGYIVYSIRKTKSEDDLGSQDLLE